MEKKQKDDVLGPEIEEIFHPDFVEKKPKNKKSSRQMEVKGEVRDVQATLVPDMQIIEKSTGKTIAVTDAKGQFKFTTGNHEYLIFKKSGYQTVEIEVKNMNVINITVNYGEN